jgi:hypothetical protein
VQFLFGRGDDFDAKILKHVLSTKNINPQNVKN